ncbi:MAG: helix-turn-helix domain-containing protein [Pseudomonadota bacterium]
MRLDLEQWREMASPFYEVYPREPVETAGVDIEVSEVNGLYLAEVATPSEMLVHDPSKNKQYDHEYLLFERFYEGGGDVEVGDSGFTVRPSRLHLIDMSQHYVSLKERSLSRGVCIPHALLGYERGAEPAFTSIDLNTPKGRLLDAAHNELLNTQEDVSNQDTAQIADSFVGLVRQLMLGKKEADGPVDDKDLPLTLLLQDYIAANLYDWDLNVDKLVRVFNVSRATLYRHFEQDGGVARYIRDRRLDRSFFELSLAEPRHGQVAAVARRWHFDNSKSFNRAFRERFKMSPSQCLASSAEQGSGAPSDQMRMTQQWLSRFRRY